MKITIPILFILLISCSNKPSFKTGKINKEVLEEFKSLVSESRNKQDSVKCLVDIQNEKFYEKDTLIKEASLASEIAYIYLSNIYGEDKIKDELPLTVYSIKDYWYIEGSLNPNLISRILNIPISGGVAEIVIRKNNGKVINIIHGK